MTDLFKDGIEPDFSAWSGTSFTAASVIDVLTTSPHHGARHARAKTAGLASDYAASYKTIAAAPIVFWKAQFKFITLNIPVGGYIVILLTADATWVNRVDAAIVNDAGTLKWLLITNNINWYYGANTPTTGTNYDVKIKQDVTNDVETLWINDVLEATAIDVLTLNTAKLYAGIVWQTDAGINELYYDCAIAADANILGDPFATTAPKGTISNQAKLVGII